MDYNKILPLLLTLSAKIKQDFDDKQLTVNELLDLVKTVVNELGFGDVVILDLSKKEDK